MALLEIALGRRIQLENLVAKEKSSLKDRTGRPGPREKSKIIAPLVKKQFLAEPEIRSKTMADFHDQWLIWKSRHPHFEFVKMHWSSFSNVWQFILFDTRRKLKVAMTMQEMREKLSGKTESIFAP